MPEHPVVVKLGGDALASPERILAAARRIRRLAAEGPVVAVASARRGVTDHLLDLVREVRGATGGSTRPHAEVDRAVATGEVVSAALLALALDELGIRAVSLDAREAGVHGAGRFGQAHIRKIETSRILRRLARGELPVITGFQGWRRGRVATLGRGGTDISAVALAAALGSPRLVFVKDAEGLRTADPKLVVDAQPIPFASHAFLSALTAAGARVLQPDAARLAETESLPLEFVSLTGESCDTRITADAAHRGLRAVATRVTDDTAEITTIATGAAVAHGVWEQIREALRAAHVPLIEIQPAADGRRYLVPAALAGKATGVIHAVFVLDDPRQIARAS